MTSTNAALHGEYAVRWWLLATSPRWAALDSIAFGFGLGRFERVQSTRTKLESQE